MCFRKKKKAEKIEKAKETSKKETKPVAKKEIQKEPTNTATVTRTYHVVKRADKKWEVKYAGGSKAIKLFDTQEEAIEYTKVMAKNQDGAYLVHNSKGQNKGKIKKKR